MPDYRQDETGQWWYYSKRARSRAQIGTCEHCGEEFPYPSSSQGRFCSNSCATSWRNGRYGRAPRIVDKVGYVMVYVPEHPRATSVGYVLEHRLVMESVLGRLLERWEQVHHINGVKDDNRPENLQLRIGPHGNGVAYCCADCGSRRLRPTSLGDPQAAEVAALWTVIAAQPFASPETKAFAEMAALAAA